MKFHSLVIGSIASFMVVAAGCSDETTSTTTAATSASSSAASTAGSGGDPTGGTGGSGQGGAGEGGAGGAGPELTNGCDEAKAVDETAKVDVMITKDAAAFAYTPKCVKVKAGTNVTFSMNFALHPLIGGKNIDGVPTPDPGSPIPTTKTGMSVMVKLPNAGTYPFYCEEHAPGMAGAIYVVP